MSFKLKNIFLILVFITTSIFSYCSTNFEQGNQFYLEGKYKEAIEVYEFIAENGLETENLCYNTANAYYKNGDLGKSILYYEKTLKINPNNTNAFHNLQLANTKIEKPLEILPDLFFVVWWKKLIHFFTMNTWAWIAISFSWFSVIAFGIYLFSKNLLFKKFAFYKSFIFGFIAIFAMIIAGISSGKIFKTKEVVLVVKSSQSKDAPSKTAANQELFYEGTKLEVKDEVNGFYKAITSEGLTVWVNAEYFWII